ncbi:SLC13 family permease [Alkalimarinus coralli]|uniref:SLC13 family permease n=1 Tax=Alkalimarinus coralli TaxID=2935863 RepID=UPI00202B85CF|nr:SLC13 family permease [Alkalimarinus coralli]
MTLEIGLLYGILAITIVLFASEWIRLDITALGVILALVLTGILSPAEALSGFGNPLVILIACLFVVGDALFKTGVAGQAGEKIVQLASGNKVLALVLVILVVAFLSAFMSSTGAVAILIPVVLSMCRRLGLAPSVIMMPLAFGALMGGMLTLIGTPPNLVVSQALKGASGQGFGFFEFAPFGAVTLVLGIVYLLLVNMGKLKQGSTSSTVEGRLTLQHLIGEYNLHGLIHRIRVPENSPLNGMSIAEARLRSQYRVTVLAYRSEGSTAREIKEVLANTRIVAGDELFVMARSVDVNLLADPGGVELLAWRSDDSGFLSREVGLAEVMLAPDSRLIGLTIKEAGVRSRSGLSVAAIKRKGEILSDDIFEERLEVGDIILAAGGWDSIAKLKSSRGDLLVLHLPEEFESVAPNRNRSSTALLIMTCMVMVLTFTQMPAVVVVLVAAIAMVLSGCLTMPQAYSAINWPSVVVIAGMLPMSLALEKTGGMFLITDYLTGLLQGQSLLIVLVGLFVITSVFSQFISNTATTVLMAPVAIVMANNLGLSEMGLLMTVAIAASTAFATPVASPVNMLVMAPGEYRFVDFVKVGIPLIGIALAVVLIMVPLLYPV